jgi:mannose-6-phosphate isomerase-like protein (cupin superfamily)
MINLGASYYLESEDLAGRLYFREMGEIIILEPMNRYKIHNQGDGDKKILMISVYQFDLDQTNISFFQKINFMTDISSVQNKIWFLPMKCIWKILNPTQHFLIIGPEKIFTGLDYALRGPQKFILNLAKTQLAEGPLSYYHNSSVEHFLVLRGKYQVKVEQNIVILEAGDMIRIKIGVLRNFTQIGHRGQNEEGLILPIIIGTNQEKNDISYPQSTRTLIRNKLPRWKRPLLRLMENGRLHFP